VPYPREEPTAISQTSCGVLRKLGPEIQRVQSYVTDDKIYCSDIAPNPDLIREHGRQGGFSANRVSQIRAVIDPAPLRADRRRLPPEHRSKKARFSRWI
jgi:hypothetical protein